MWSRVIPGADVWSDWSFSGWVRPGELSVDPIGYVGAAFDSNVGEPVAIRC